MLSFLIAVIKGIFDKQKAKQDENAYRDRASMNMKFDYLMKFYGFHHDICNCQVLWANVEEDRKLLQPSQLDILA